MASKTLLTTWDQDQGGSIPDGHRNVQIVITEIGNDLRFDVAIVDPQNNDDLRALFFNVRDDAVSGLAVKESWVAGVRQASNFASRVDANGVDSVVDKNEKLSGNYDNHKIKNSTFDLGVEFPGGNSNVTAASFTLTGGANRKLTLDLVGEELFGIRAHGQKLIVSGATDGVNTKPEASPVKDVVTNEDASLSSVAIGATDRDGDTLSYAVKDGAGPQKGTVSFNQANGTFTYVPNANASGSDTFTILVSDGRGGATEQQVKVAVNPVNDAPQGADKTVALSQDGAYTFSISDFGFSDPHDAPSHALKALVITGLPAAGTLTLNGAAVTAGQTIDAASLSKLVFTPAPGGSGAAYATFTFKVQDNGGTANGGQDTSAQSTFTFDVAPPANHKPTAAASVSLATDEDIAHGPVAIGAVDADGDHLTYSIKDGHGPQKGTVSLDQDAGTFTYSPAADSHGSDSLTIVIDDGHGGTVEQVVSVSIHPVNDAPTSANGIQELAPGESYAFSAGDFPFADLRDAAAPDALKAVIITELPSAGTLALQGVAVAKGQAIDAASLSQLVFIAAGDASGADYGAFTFRVQDAGGTERGGQDTSREYTFAFDIAPVQGVSHDDLIEAGDGSDTIYGGLGNDEMQGEGGNDLIVGGRDGGRLVRSEDGSLQSVVIGDNLYGNDGQDTYHFKQGDGVDMVWDFRPGEDVIRLTGYKVQGATILDDPQTGYRLEDIRVMFVRHVVEANDRLDAGAYDKIAVLLGSSGDAIIFNDFPAPSDNDATLVLADGVLSSGELLRMAQASAAIDGSAGTSGIDLFGPPSGSSGASVPLTLTGTNDGDTLIGAAGDDRVYGNEGVNTLNGKGGHDRLYGGNTRDVLLGEDGDDIGYGNGGSDLIIGGSGSDRLYGAGGDDLIFGDDGEGVELPSEWLAPSGHGISAKVEVVHSWWGGFEGRITVAANESIDHWKLALRSHFKIDTIWGADKAGEVGENGSLLYDLDNTLWNGGLANGQTTTIGFTARTDIAGALDPADLLRALSVATEGAPDDLPPLPSSGKVETGMEVVKSWSGGFEGKITLKADANTTHWEVLLRTKFKIDSLWGAEKAAEMSEHGATVYSLDNTKWNGVLREGETITIGFTARTGTSATLTREQILDPAKLALANDDGSVNSSANGIGRKLMGGTGNDTLFSGDSKDVLSGLQGKDAFVFSSKLNTKSNVDKITDFNVKDDTVKLENAIFKQVGKTGTLEKDTFWIGDKAHDTSDRIIYDKKKGELYYDADGSGSRAAVQFATLKEQLKLTHKDFFVI